MDHSTKKIWIGLFVLLAVLTVAVCVCSAAWVAGGLILARLDDARENQAVLPAMGQAIPLAIQTATAQPTEQLIPVRTAVADPEAVVKPDLDKAYPDPSAGAKTREGLSGAFETLETLEKIDVPENNLVELAQRLGGITAPPIASQAAIRRVGDGENFWVMDVNENRNFQVPARLVYITDQVYFWVEDGVLYNERALKRLADTFDRKIMPTDRQFFGSEWNPGIDGDPRVHILYARGLGNTIAGYFSSADEYPAVINEFSNTKEMFVFNADTTLLDRKFTYGVLAHEFQHMIHWYQDRNEETWLNEGFADLASFLNGYTIGGADLVFMANPDLQLNHWPAEPDTAHYGAAFLFLTYFLDRFGEKASQSLVADPANGLTSIDQVLGNISEKDGLTGEPIQADDVFIDWAIANYLQDRQAADGRYGYKNYPEAPAAGPTEILSQCPSEVQDRQVHQYGADYIRIRCRGNYLLRFEGASQVALMPAQAHSGSYVMWSNRGDESDMTLTQTFDFRNHSGPLTLSYWTWFDIEKGFDHLYLLASENKGQSWQILNTPSGSLEDLSGTSFGWAYTGMSGNGGMPRWIQEQVDLSSLAGKEVLLRFEYVTDAAANNDGFLLDDLSISEVGYASDFEIDAGGWEAQGFGRVQNALPQTFRLGLIEKGDATQVSLFEPLAGQTVEIPIQISADVKEVILVVSGTTRITRQEADYRFEILAASDR